MLVRIMLMSVVYVQVLGQFALVPDASPKKMTLTPGDLKVFSGHALNLLQAKCPQVNTSTLRELNKFIGKAIAKDSTPFKGNDAGFKQVVDSMTSCAKKVNQGQVSEKPEVKPNAEESSEFFFFVPADGEMIQLTPDSDEKTPGAKPVEVQPDSAPAKEDEKPDPGLPTEKSNERRKNPLVFWISSMLASVQEFFRNLFGSRRAESETADSTVAPPSGIIHRRAAEDPTGKGAFTRLYTEVCRLYCDKCAGPLQSRAEFKMAANQFLDHLFTIVPPQGLDLAATHHLTQEFMQSVEQCN